MSRLAPPPRLTPDTLRAIQPTGAAAQRLRAGSHGSHSSGSSHSSHSSHQERQREQHLGEAPGGLPSVAKPVAAAVAVLLFLFAGQAIGFWLFTKGFLLTRTTLEGVSTCSRPAHSTWTLPMPPLQLTSDEDYDAWQGTLTHEAECTLPARYNRTLLWIIDALRFDFIADVHSKVHETSWSPNPHYQGVLDLPARLDKQHDTFSLLTHFLADAPTTTLQRLKGLTTGSLPTFVDAGSNFGGAEITEDNWLEQLRFEAMRTQQSAKMALMGDDTWLTVFPNVFDEAWRFPFDSFNVEDLDGVDRGVERTLKPFMNGKNTSLSEWRLLVAHTLGVDHVGHRLGAAHPRMRAKLQEMNTFLTDIVDWLPDDALLVLMGDHGMDDKGDHGGDGELEVGAGLWMYAKKGLGGSISEEELKRILQPSQDLLRSHRPFSMLPSPPFAADGHRSVAQIDFVPTISLLLGLPIPFNNLGSVIPEAFSSTEELLRALRINAFQVHRYLRQYGRASGELKPFESELEAAWRDALRFDARLALSSHSEAARSTLEAAQAYLYFNRLALVRASSVWAKFEAVKMFFGLAMLALSVAVLLRVKTIAGEGDVESLFVHVVHQSRTGLAAGTSLGMAGKLVSLFVVPLPFFSSLGFFESAATGGIFFAQVALLLYSKRAAERQDSDWSGPGVVLPILHSLAFSSNSFTIWEDKLVVALVSAALLFRGVQGYLGAPTARLKLRMPALALTAALAVRLASTIGVCREEQAPHCRTTFYVAAQSTLSSPITIALAYGCALAVPTLLKRALRVSRSDAGVAPLFFTWMLRPALLAGAGYWFIDWLLTADVLLPAVDGEGRAVASSSTSAILETSKLALARFDFALLCVIALAFWIFSPLLIDLTEEKIDDSKAGDAAVATPRSAGRSTAAAQDAGKPTTRIIVLGFANSLGSSYMLLLSLVFALHFLVAQPAGQLALSLMLLAILACAELGDHERDALLVQQSLLRPPSDAAAAAAAAQTALPVSMFDTSVLALLGFVAFFATGHQATFASIQWRTAFVGFRTVHDIFSPILVMLNSFGPIALLPALALPLLVLWNLAPRPRGGPKAGDASDVDKRGHRMKTVMHILQAALSYLLYHLIIAIAAATFAAYFRRHLMLFKIWAPRFMLGVVSVQLTFLGLVLGLIAAGNVMSKVTVTFGSLF